ncbi:flagellar hook-basal body protein [Paenibacillus allorhizosphaerae]|uniref:Flagellar basal-body rod protein FlgG n=1 Tax=Paenibacillus allorhizosphaerae TaxID=2849866 RepID=A0ABM8VRN0_9BACL|nr:flagellar hook-basal body protein [Paenibacillus allorhizosphaerae]CAG7655536.1 Flagellar basal-body rod protein FlgG [Paenibacillus allorhizosphaerae]
MLRGLYTAASGMIAQQRKHDIVTNNVANLNTPGFKGGTGINRSFPEVLISRVRNGKDEPGAVSVGRINTGVMAEENVSLHAQGDIRETNNPFDFALISNIQVPGARFDSSGKYVDENGVRVIQPQAFFTIMNAAGEQRYSLNGKFSVDANGQLIDSDGRQVMDRNQQPIVLVDPATNTPITNFRISRTGQFTNIDGEPLLGAGGQPVSLLITRVEDPNLLIREGNGLYRLTEEDQGTIRPIDDLDQVEVRQGYIERSNVDTGQSMVDMMSALRAYEANQKMIQYYDKSMEKAVNEIGRI